MAKYEYYQSTKSEPVPVKALNVMTEDNWLLVHFTETKSSYYYVWKREIKEKQD